VRKQSRPEVTTCVERFFLLAPNAATSILLLHPTSLHLFLVHGHRPAGPHWLLSPVACCPLARRSQCDAGDDVISATASCPPRRQRKPRWPCTMATANTHCGLLAYSTAPSPGTADCVHRPPGTDFFALIALF
jgi:hypothetical protein